MSSQGLDASIWQEVWNVDVDQHTLTVKTSLVSWLPERVWRFSYANSRMTALLVLSMELTKLSASHKGGDVVHGFFSQAARTPNKQLHNQSIANHHEKRDSNLHGAGRSTLSGFVISACPSIP